MPDTQTHCRIASFTRPANVTAYAAGQVVSGGSPMQFPGIMPNGLSGRLTRVWMTKSTNAVGSANFTLFLFNQNPGAVADQSTFAPLYSARASWIGAVTLPIMLAGGSNAAYTEYLPVPGEVPIQEADGGVKDVWGILVATAAYTPGNAEIFEVRLFVEPEGSAY